MCRGVYISIKSSTDRSVSFYQNSSVWLDILASRSWDRNPVDSYPIYIYIYCNNIAGKITYLCSHTYIVDTPIHSLIHPSIHQPTHLPIHWFIYPFIQLVIYLPTPFTSSPTYSSNHPPYFATSVLIHLSTDLLPNQSTLKFIPLSTHPSADPSIKLSTHMLIRRFTYLYTYPTAGGARCVMVNVVANEHRDLSSKPWRGC